MFDKTFIYIKRARFSVCNYVLQTGRNMEHVFDKVITARGGPENCGRLPIFRIIYEIRKNSRIFYLSGKISPGPLVKDDLIAIKLGN